MKQIALAALLAACIPTPTKLVATSQEWLERGNSETHVAAPPADAIALVIEKLGARGFTVVETTHTPTGVLVKLAGNRDFNGVHTLGSVFYAWVEPENAGSHVRIVGKPTVDHGESCPSVAGDYECKTISTEVVWGITGREEAQVIHGVFAELTVQDDTFAAAPAGEPPVEGGLSLRGCGGAMRWAAGKR